MPDDGSIYGGPHTEACLRAPWGAFSGVCPGPRHHGWGLGTVIMAARKRCIESPLFLATHVLSCVWQANLFVKPSEGHRIVEKAIIDQRDLLYVDSRSTGKTTLVDECGSVWQLLKYWNDSILLLQATEPVARERSGQIRNHFIVNPRMKEMFPEYHMSTTEQIGDMRSWNVPCRTIITTEGSFDIGTPGASKTGNHYDVILGSDLMNPSTTPPPCGLSTMENMKAQIAFYAQSDGLLKTKSVNPRAHKRLDLNRWHDADLAGELIRKDTNNSILKVIRGVTRDENGRFVSSWPEQISSEELHEIHSRPSMNSATWSANYCAKPELEGGMRFERKNFHYFGDGAQCPAAVCSSGGKYVVHDMPKKMNIRICVDPSFADGKTEKKATDRSAMVAVGIAANGGHFYVLEVRAGRWGPHDFVENLFQMCTFWKPQWVGIEDTAGSRGLKAMFMSEMARTGRFIKYRGLQPMSQSKDARIAPLLAHSQHFGLYFRRAQVEAMEELERYKLMEHDDIADALGYVARDLYDMPTQDRDEAEVLDFVPPTPNDTGAAAISRAKARAHNRNRMPWRPTLRIA